MTAKEKLEATLTTTVQAPEQAPEQAPIQTEKPIYICGGVTLRCAADHFTWSDTQTGVSLEIDTPLSMGEIRKVVRETFTSAKHEPPKGKELSSLVSGLYDQVRSVWPDTCDRLATAGRAMAAICASPGARLVRSSYSKTTGQISLTVQSDAARASTPPTRHLDTIQSIGKLVNLLNP
jgi:hypothetical protein